MSWHCLLEMAEESSPLTCLGSGLYVPSSGESTVGECLSSGNKMGACNASRSGTTSGHSMGSHGEDALTSYLAGFPVRSKALPRLDETMRMTFGRRCGESWQMQLPGLCLRRTSAPERSSERLPTAARWVTKPTSLPLARRTWVLTTFGSDIGFLHTPTTKANYAAPSMQKWPSARAFVTVFGRPSPENHEWLMGWPDGWSDTSPLEMDSFRSWLHQHFAFLPALERAALSELTP